MRWAQHLNRMGENRVSKQVFYWYFYFLINVDPIQDLKATQGRGLFNEVVVVVEVFADYEDM